MDKYKIAAIGDIFYKIEKMIEDLAKYIKDRGAELLKDKDL